MIGFPLPDHAPKLWYPFCLGATSAQSVDSSSLYPVTAVAVMEMDVTSDTVEVLPQHKFDIRSLEAYLNQHLPGFGSDPRAVLTVTQYRYQP